MVEKVATLTRLSPLDGSTVLTVPVTPADRAPQIVATARHAFPAWSTMPIEHRGQIIRKAARLLEERSGELAEIVRQETGKPIGASQGEVGGAIEMGYLMASHGRHAMGSLLPSAVPLRQVRVQRMPRGVALLIVTYNAPLPNYAWKVFPALMAGNTAILKPSPATPKSAEHFVGILHEAGVPKDALQLVHGYGEVASALIDAGVDLVSFTGSYPTGQKVVEASARILAKTVIELGGANPLIVCADANLNAAATVVLDSALSNAGQRCSSASRILIENSIYEQFRDLLLEKAATVTWGTEPDADVSTLIDEQSVSAFEAYLEGATKAGGRVHRVGIAQGTPVAGACVTQPAIVEGLPIDSQLGMAEFFGPATRLFRFTGDDEAVAMANTSEYGLTAAVWSRDIARAEAIVSRLEAGVININGPTHGAEINMPFGGVKHSGNGSRDAGISAIDQYSDVQVVSTFFGV
jgi:aldehyde dehydrogenase (NAD+)